MNARARTIIVVTATLLLSMIVLLPRITKAARFKWFGPEKALSANLALAGNLAQEQKPDITVVASYHNDTSVPVRDMKPQPVLPKTEHENKNPKVPTRHIDSPDPVVQDRMNVLQDLFTPSMPSPLLNFDGIGFPGVACNCAPHPETRCHQS